MNELIKVSEPVAGVDLVVLPTGVREVVSVRISLPAGSRFMQGSPVPEFVAGMLELGVEGKSKEEIAKLLESNAITWSVTCGTTWVDISVAMPKTKLDIFAELLSMMLFQPTFPDNELEVFKQRGIAGVLQSKQETGPQAWKKLCQNIFLPSHPMYEESEEVEIERIKSVTRQELVNFHAQYYGTGKIKFVVTGDVASAGAWERFVRSVFSGANKINVQIDKNFGIVEAPSKTSYVTLQEKASADAFFGYPITLDVNSREYFALKLGLHILGGDFVSRLMQEVREKRGLTYGTSASISGINDGDTGLFFTWGTFAPNLLAKGLEVTKKVISGVVKKGITKQELERAREAIPGNFLVSLSNSSGVATAIMNILQTGKDLSFLDTYPALIKSLTLSEVNKSLKTHIHPAKLILTVAGSVDNLGKPI